MCVTFLAIPDGNKLLLGKYKLILLNNRDEDFSRETSHIEWRNGILSGRDEKADERGTWLGIDRKGRVGNLLSITEPYHLLKKDAPTRGRLINDFLANESSANNYLSKISMNANEFNGFQILILDRIEGDFELYSLTNKLGSTAPIHWPKGIYGFGNSPPSIPYQKVIYGEKKFREILARFQSAVFIEDDLVSALFEMASDRTINFPDEQIRLQTGAPEGSDLYKFLCSLFVDGEYPIGRAYGTRSSSIILIDAGNNVIFHERRVLDQSKPMEDPSKWQFSVQKFSIALQNDRP